MINNPKVIKTAFLDKLYQTEVGGVLQQASL
jgi:hypothetical protein